MGLIIGAMIDALLAQRRTDRSIFEYLENPGPSAFDERIPGSTAFCALAVLVMHADGAVRLSKIALTARTAFGTDEEWEPELESYARAAAAVADRLNPDLLSESLLARLRKGAAEDRLETIRDALIELASGTAAKKTAKRIAELLAPGEIPRLETEADDSYTLLGVPPSASLDEVKTAYRRLAVLFHPDASVGLDEGQQKSAAEAFIRIDGAYRMIVERRGESAGRDR
jgi:DnaJ-domain-containing protein 1